MVVTPEYNRSFPASLKQAIDYAYDEWRAKPVAFVSYGCRSEGMYAVEQLRSVFTELHAVTMRDGVGFNLLDGLDGSGRPREADGPAQATGGACSTSSSGGARAARSARRAPVRLLTDVNTERTEHERHVDGLAIETSGLVKMFGDTRAVDGVDLAVPAGTVYGVLGPNGAGKTTAVRMLATLLRPDGGEARVFGHDVRARGRRRAQPGQPDRAVRLGRRGPDRHREPDPARPGCSGTGKPAARARAGAAAGGVRADRRRRHARSRTTRAACAAGIDIAASILNTPDLLFLDEPTTGLDPRSRNQVWDIVRAVVAQGTTVLLTTQYLDEADQLAGRIAVIDHGKVIAEGTPGELKASVGAGTVHVRLRDAAAAARGRSGCWPQALGRPGAAGRRPGRADRARRRTAAAERGAAEQASRALAELARVRHHRRRLLPRPAQPGRGLPRPHRPPRTVPTTRRTAA